MTHHVDCNEVVSVFFFLVILKTDTHTLRCSGQPFALRPESNPLYMSSSETIEGLGLAMATILVGLIKLTIKLRSGGLKGGYASLDYLSLEPY